MRNKEQLIGDLAELDSDTLNRINVQLNKVEGTDSMNAIFIWNVREIMKIQQQKRNEILERLMKLDD